MTIQNSDQPVKKKVKSSCGSITVISTSAVLALEDEQMDVYHIKNKMIDITYKHNARSHF